MFCVYAKSTKYKITEALFGHRRARSHAARKRAMRQLLLPADVVRRLYGQMVRVAAKSICQGGLVATEMHVPDVPDAVLHFGRLLCGNR